MLRILFLLAIQRGKFRELALWCFGHTGKDGGSPGVAELLFPLNDVVHIHALFYLPLIQLLNFILRDKDYRLSQYQKEGHSSHQKRTHGNLLAWSKASISPPRPRVLTNTDTPSFKVRKCLHELSGRVRELIFAPSEGFSDERQQSRQQGTLPSSLLLPFTAM